MRPLLEVVVLGPGDVPGAVEGGADRLEIAADVDAGGLTPAAETVRDIRHACDLPLRVMLRANDGFSTSGSELARLKVAVHQLASAGADGFVTGFLGLHAEIDVDTTLALADEFDGRPWTFHHAIDHALDHDHAWSAVSAMPGVDAISTSGSPRGIGNGLDELCARAANSSDVAKLIMAGGGLEPDHVPWLARAGVRQFRLASKARPGGGWRAYVDTALVRSWRSLIDDAVAATL